MREPYSISTCVHYRSSSMVCRADIEPCTFLDDEDRLPCVVIRGITGKRSCNRLKFPEVPATGPVGRMGKALTAILSKRCPTCDGEIAAEMEFNSNVLAMPCRHVIRSAK